jgi:hypothetical protein
MVMLLCAGACGCALRCTGVDPDVALAASMWEMPRLDQQRIALEFETHTTEDCYACHERLRRAALRILRDTGKLRLVEGNEQPDARVTMIVRIRRETHTLKTALNALVLYAWPIDAEEYRCEVLLDVRNPSGEPIAHSYVQGRAAGELWLGYLFWPRWLGNAETGRGVQHDALKAAAVKLCRALAPEAKQP